MPMPFSQNRIKKPYTWVDQIGLGKHQKEPLKVSSPQVIHDP